MILYYLDHELNLKYIDLGLPKLFDFGCLIGARELQADGLLRTVGSYDMTSFILFNSIQFDFGSLAIC